jgi:glutamyl-tRNA synthetase
MDWGNIIIQQVQSGPEGVPVIEAILHLEGDFKKTKKKLTWLAATDEVVPCTLVDYDYLITKKKLEEDDKLEDFLTPVSEFKVCPYSWYLYIQADCGFVG